MSEFKLSVEVIEACGCGSLGIPKDRASFEACMAAQDAESRAAQRKEDAERCRVVANRERHCRTGGRRVHAAAFCAETGLVGKVLTTGQ